jgi:co-chaperonin GroES (HSP10)
MKSSYYFIVEVEKDYNNYETLPNGLKIMTNNSIETVEAINRVGTIISAPKGTIADKGDKLLFHHNICRREHGFKGAKRLSPFQVTKNIFFVPIMESYMLDKGNGWQAVDPYVFLLPIKEEPKVLANGLKIVAKDHKGMNEYSGIVAYGNKALEQQGIKEGDVVGFTEYSQHEYELDGKIYYRMTTNDITCKY